MGITGTYLTLYGGVGQIGGNIVLLEHGDTRVLVDFGKDFQLYRRFYDYPFPVPTHSMSQELVKTGLAPEIRDAKGRRIPLYAGYENGVVAEPKEPPGLDGVFISHPHFDHSGLVTLLRSDATVRMGKMSDVIWSASLETRADFSIETKLYWGKGEEEKPRLKVHDFRTGDRIKAGPMSIRPVSVDHSVPGAYGFIIDTPEGRIAYTGDIRMHGPARRLTERFVRELEQEPPDLLICEGTNVNVGSPLGEEHVKEGGKQVIAKAFARGAKVVVVEVRSNDLDRVNSFYSLAREMDCDIVLSPRLAYLLRRIEAAGLASSLLGGVPKLGGEVKVLARQRARRPRWESDLLRSPNISALGEGELAKPEKRVVMITGSRINVFETRLPKGSVYIMSISEHQAEEEESGEERHLNALALHGIPAYRIHSSGHAPPLDLLEIISRANPRRLLPVHTEHPEAFRELVQTPEMVILAEKRVPIHLR